MSQTHLAAQINRQSFDPLAYTCIGYGKHLIASMEYQSNLPVQFHVRQFVHVVLSLLFFWKIIKFSSKLIHFVKQ